ncbi:MAG TPA: RsmB/NOP family class I SAM-dependent RNA methyltransferase, partial [Cyclobacteriaceae bacterium]|nr:RsmB/NOP family class I SAM-dependent RNA methyltransferase [Cyclobacteriaceae bacterium]
PRWGARDRRFIAEATYTIIRQYRLLKESAMCAEGDYLCLVAAYLALQGYDLSGWPEFRIDPHALAARREAMMGTRTLRESIPDWLDNLGERELGDRWTRELHALNEEAPLVLRANTLKNTADELQRILIGEGIETELVDGFPDALIVKKRQNIFKLKSFHEGRFEVQDAASQMVAPFVDVTPGLRIVDACAGAGGKSLHLAALMKNRGRLISLDVAGWKLTELRRRARRAGVNNLETRLIDSPKVVKRLKETADRVLLDVPCSGLGVLKRNPDTKWKLTEKQIEEIGKQQEEILDTYAGMVRPGGFLVYATCSILPSENETRVRAFLERRKGAFELIDEKRLWPSDGFDGFYMARLQRST